MLAAIVRLADHRRAERVGFDDIGPGVEIGRVNGFDDVRPGQAEQVIIALLVIGQIEAAAIIVLAQPIILDRRAIAAIEHQDAFRGKLLQLFARAVHAAFSCRAPVGLLPSKWQMA